LPTSSDFKLRQNVPMFVDKVCQPVEDDGPVVRGHRRPTAFAKCLARCRHGQVYVRYITRSQMRYYLSVTRVVDFQGHPAFGVHPLSPDEQLLRL